ncbi:MAG: serine/threonine protein kinase [Alphaproteobacteria bacterium]|nr:serine/threonine protein kinase [Alphaproteobacteria bacterium]
MSGDRFALVGELGRGGTATVWLAEDASRGERVALKVVHAHLADRPSTRRRLARELQAAARVRHPAILHPLEEVEHGGSPALVLPALSGQTLLDRIERDGPLAEPDLRLLLARVGGALAAAHGAGVLHRDVTPRNVLWDDGGEPMLTDFGLARLADQGTATTGALGTVGYAAPEVYTAGARDPRADAYGLGAVLYLAAAGRPAYDAPTAMGALQAQLDGRHTPLAEQRPDLDPALVGTIEALLRPEPEDRPSVSEALHLTSRAAATAAPVVRRRWGRIGSAISLWLLVALGFFQDLGSFALSTVILGHGVAAPDIHQMTQGITMLILLPLVMVPALVSIVAKDRAPGLRAGGGVLAAMVLAYAIFAGVVAPEQGMGAGWDLVGTMLYHQMAWVLLVGAVVALARPWGGFTVTAPASAPVRVPLASEARRALDALLALDVPEIVRADLRGLCKDLGASIGELEAELGTVDDALGRTAADPGLLAQLEARRARAAAHGQPTGEHDRAVEAQRRLLAEVDALEERRVAAVARLLEIRAEAVHAGRQLQEAPDPEPTTRDLRTLRDRARDAAGALQRG